MRTRGYVLALLPAVGCGYDRRDEADSPPETTIGAEGTGASDDDDDDAADDDDDDAADDGVSFDVPGDSAGDSHNPDDSTGCEKVDFVFVIDNSGSMADEQQALIDSFPPFIDAIEARLGNAPDIHILTTDVDGWVYEECEEACVDAAACEAMGFPQCGDPEDCWFPCALRDLCTVDGDYACGVTQPTECEDVLGAGVTHPRGRQASNLDCDFASGARYMTGAEPDLAGAFACAARVGTGSSADTELTMEALVAALSAPTAGCNDGFLRDDAILVVTFITDEDDDPTDSTGSPQSWFDTVVAAKGGESQPVVVLGLFGDNDLPGGICDDLSHDFATGAEAAPRLREFVSMWGDQGIAGTVCAESYVDFFVEAVETIGVACDEFVPPG